MTQINSSSTIGQEQNTRASHINSNQNNCKSFQLKCGSLNVCGIRRKLQYPEFRELISNYDLFCVTESKLDNYDIVDVPGYKFISQTRRQKCLHRPNIIKYKELLNTRNKKVLLNLSKFVKSIMNRF